MSKEKERTYMWRERERCVFRQRERERWVCVQREEIEICRERDNKYTRKKHHAGNMLAFFK